MPRFYPKLFNKMLHLQLAKMPKKKKIPEAERLRLKRECERKRREKINNDPQAKILLQEKERFKYLKKKEKKQVKSVKEMTTRELRGKRKQWRENTKNYRQRKRAEERLVPSTPPSSPDNLIPEQLIAHRPNVQKRNGKKLMRRDRSKLFRENVKLKDKVKSLQRLADKYRMRNKRLTSPRTSASIKLSPKSRVENLIVGQRVSPEVKRKLLFGEALKEQLEENYQGLQKRKLKLMFARLVTAQGGF